MLNSPPGQYDPDGQIVQLLLPVELYVPGKQNSGGLE
jgi:hypothetical protein